MKYLVPEYLSPIKNIKLKMYKVQILDILENQFKTPMEKGNLKGGPSSVPRDDFSTIVQKSEIQEHWGPNELMQFEATFKT